MTFALALQATFEAAVNDDTFARRLCDRLFATCPAFRRSLVPYSRGALEKRITQALAKVVDASLAVGSFAEAAHLARELVHPLDPSPDQLCEHVACLMSVVRATLAEILREEWSADSERAWVACSAELEAAARCAEVG